MPKETGYYFFESVEGERKIVEVVNVDKEEYGQRRAIFTIGEYEAECSLTGYYYGALEFKKNRNRHIKKPYIIHHAVHWAGCAMCGSYINRKTFWSEEKKEVTCKRCIAGIKKHGVIPGNEKLIKKWREE